MAPTPTRATPRSIRDHGDRRQQGACSIVRRRRRRAGWSRGRGGCVIARMLADLVVLAHLTFIGFVTLGGLLALRWRWLPWLHLPAVGWGVLLEFFGWTCPLTPLENWLRRLGGAQGYSSSFVERYVLPVIYPAALTRRSQVVLGVLLCAVNVTVYLWLLYRRVRLRDDSLAR